jgi:hypothetical protein
MTDWYDPLIPAKAVTQKLDLDSRLRGNELYWDVLALHGSCESARHPLGSAQILAGTPLRPDSNSASGSEWRRKNFWNFLVS